MDDIYRSYHERLEATLETLPDKPRENPANTLRALWHAATGRPVSVVLADQHALEPLTDAAMRARLEGLLERRLAGEPLAYITGRSHFMGIEFLSDPGALIPRLESELLTDACIELLRRRGAAPPAQVIDVCAGSGNVALAIARHVPGSTVIGADISAEAIALAERNAAHLGHPEVTFRCGDLLEPFGAEFDAAVDLVACAPPYILSAKVPAMAPEIASHEPRLAFDGGPLGVGILLRLIEQAPRLLRAGGWLALEVGLGQGPALARRLARNTDYDEIRPLENDDGDVRVLLARRR